MSSLIVTKSAVSGYVCARRTFGKATIQVVSRPIVMPLLPVLVVPTVAQSIAMLAIATGSKTLGMTEARALVLGW
jgi:hypothetical protein